MLPSTLHIIWPIDLQSLKLLFPIVYEDMYLQENVVFDLWFGFNVTQKLPSALYIMWTMHLQSLKLLRQTV